MCSTDHGCWWEEAFICHARVTSFLTRPVLICATCRLREGKSCVNGESWAGHVVRGPAKRYQAGNSNLFFE